MSPETQVKSIAGAIKKPDLAAVALFAQAVDAHAAGDDRRCRAATPALYLLGWRVTPERKEP